MQAQPAGQLLLDAGQAIVAVLDLGNSEQYCSDVRIVFQKYRPYLIRLSESKKKNAKANLGLREREGERP